MRLTDILVKSGSGATGIPAIDRFIRNNHPAFVARDREIFLTDDFARRTSISDSIILGELVGKSGAPSVIAKATASINSRTEKLRALAEELPDRLAEAERSALAAVARDQSDRSLSEWLARRRAARESEEAAADLIAATERAETEFLSTPEYAEACVSAMEKLASTSRKTDYYLGANVALRCAALIHFVQKANAEATGLARDLLAGKSAEPLPPHLIPSEWIERGAPPGFVWDEMALVPS